MKSNNHLQSLRKPCWETVLWSGSMWAHTASCSLYLALLRPPSAGMFTEINSLTWKHTTPRPVLQM